MRGLLNVLTRERDLSRYREALFITSGPASLVDKIIGKARADFPNLRTTYLAPRSFVSQIQFPGEVLIFEDLKKTNLGSFLGLRNRKFDVCIFIAGAHGSFRRAKLSAFALNASRVLVYHRTGLYTPIDRAELRRGLSRLIGGLRALFSRRHLATTYEARVAREKELFAEVHSRSREDLTEASNQALEYVLDKVQRKIQRQTGRNAWEHV